MKLFYLFLYFIIFVSIFYQLEIYASCCQRSNQITYKNLYLPKVIRRCGCCKKIGHNIRTCTNKCI